MGPSVCTLLLIEPEAAQYEPSHTEHAGTTSAGEKVETGLQGNGGPKRRSRGKTDTVSATLRPRIFRGAAEVSLATANMRMAEIADEVISVLLSEPYATVKVVVEISAEFPGVRKTGSNA